MSQLVYSAGLKLKTASESILDLTVDKLRASLQSDSVPEI
jgi:hypothetical protein